MKKINVPSWREVEQKVKMFGYAIPLAATLSFSACNFPTTSEKAEAGWVKGTLPDTLSHPTVQQIKLLDRIGGNYVNLDGITELKDREVATAIGGLHKNVSLNGLTNDVEADILGKLLGDEQGVRNKGANRHFNGLTQLTIEQAQALSNHIQGGPSISLYGLTSMNKQIVEILGNNENINPLLPKRTLRLHKDIDIDKEDLATLRNARQVFLE